LKYSLLSIFYLIKLQIMPFLNNPIKLFIIMMFSQNCNNNPAFSNKEKNLNTGSKENWSLYTLLYLICSFDK
jgi:hypothetical protein